MRRSLLRLRLLRLLLLLLRNLLRRERFLQVLLRARVERPRRQLLRVLRLQHRIHQHIRPHMLPLLHVRELLLLLVRLLLQRERLLRRDPALRHRLLLRDRLFRRGPFRVILHIGPLLLLLLRRLAQGRLARRRQGLHQGNDIQCVRERRHRAERHVRVRLRVIDHPQRRDKLVRVDRRVLAVRRGREADLPEDFRRVPAVVGNEAGVPGNKGRWADSVPALQAAREFRKQNRANLYMRASRQRRVAVHLSRSDMQKASANFIRCALALVWAQVALRRQNLSLRCNASRARWWLPRALRCANLRRSLIFAQRNC